MKEKRIFALSIAFVVVLALVLSGSASGQTKAKPSDKKANSAVQKQAAASTVEETFKKTFPQIPFDSITATDAKGLYEVVIGSDIVYFMPDAGYVLLGNIITKDEQNLTEQRKGAMTTAKAKNLPLDKAIKIGSGKNIVIEFTDPDCPFCRKASTFLDGKKDLMTRYIFYFPLPMHNDAENKMKYVFCATDKAQAYHDSMAGKLDDLKYEKCVKPEATELLNLHKELGKKIGVNGTPFFIINGKKTVVGANTQAIEAALEK